MTDKNTNTPPVKLSMAERYPMTIPQEMFDSWQRLKKSGDAAKLVDKLKVSRPVIDHALKYGHVKKEFVSIKINAFFIARVQKINEAQNNLTIPTKTD